MLFEPAHDADERQASRAAATEGDANPPALLLRLFTRGTSREACGQAEEDTEHDVARAPMTDQALGCP